MRLLPKRQLRVRGKTIGGEKPLLCLPLLEERAEDLCIVAGKLKALAPDIVEWRIDGFEDLSSSSKCLEILTELRVILDTIPLLLTYRTVQEGGRSKHELSREKRLHLLNMLIASGNIDLVDVELGNGTDFIGSITEVALRHDVKKVLSYHNLVGTPSKEELFVLIRKMRENGADIVKLAVTPLCHKDVLSLFSVSYRARESFLDIPMIIIAMGKMGKISRLAAGFFGGDISFAKAAKASAPGQIDITDMRQMIRLFY